MENILRLVKIQQQQQLAGGNPVQRVLRIHRLDFNMVTSLQDTNQPMITNPENI